MARRKKAKTTSKKTAENKQMTVLEGPISAALRNELILQTISSFLSLPDQKSFRLVNSTWNRASLIEIRKQSGTINLHARILRWHERHLRENLVLQYPDVSKASHYSNRTDKDTTIVRKALIRLIENSKIGFPCAKFKLDQAIVEYHFYTFFHFFLQAVCGFVEDLEIRISLNHLDLDFPKDLSYANLKTLKVCIYNNHLPSLKQWLMPILEKASVLNTLSFNIGFNCNNILLCCIKALDNPHGRKVKNLHLQGYITDEHLNKLSQIGLSLTKLHLVLDENSQVYANGFTSVLQSQSLSLLDLHINSSVFTDREFTLSFPRMENLKSLKIFLKRALSKVQFPGLDYAQQFPVLEQLTFEGYIKIYADLEQIFSESMKPLKTVDRLKLPEGLTSSTKIIQAARTFPDVKKLEIRCSAEKLKIVGDYMKNLEELTYDFNFYDLENRDGLGKVLTGFTTHELKCMEKAENEDRKPLIDKKREPLDFLHKLKILRIENAKISNLMCKLGLQKLRNLKLLDLQLCRDLEITKQTLADMRRNFVVLLPDEV